MRLITSLSLGVAALALAGMPLYAQNAIPAVPFAPAPQATRQAPPTTTPAATAPPTTAPAAPPAASTTADAKPAAPAVTSNGIIAVVNDQSISDYELEQRVAFAIAVGGFGAKLTEEELKRVRTTTLQQMEEEKIQVAEARRLKISVSPVEVKEQVDSFLKDQNASEADLVKELTKAGTNLETFRTQQIASLAWRKVIQEVFASERLVTPAMLDDAMRRAAEGATKPQYHVAEIFLAVDREEDNAKVKAEMEGIEKQIRSGASFRNVARQYSRNPSAARGGDMGIVYDGQLEPELNSALASLTKGELSKPIRGRGGWYLLGLQDRIEPLGTSVTPEEPPSPPGPPGTLPLARMSLGLPPGSTKEQVDNTMKIAMQIAQMADSCATLEKLSHEPALKGSIYENRGNQLLAELHPDLQKALAQTKSGEVAMPVLIPDFGVEIFVRCDKRAPPPRTVFKMPTRDDVEQRLFSEQVGALARRYLRDLKRDASITERGRDNIVDAALVK